MRGNKENLGKLVKNFTGSANEHLTQRLQKMLNDCKEGDVNDWKIIKKRLLGVALKLRVHGLGDVGQKLENLVNQLFGAGKDFETICSVLRVFMKISGEIYNEYKEEKESKQDNEIFPIDESEESKSWGKFTPTTVYSQIEGSISTLTPSFNSCENFDGILSSPSYSQGKSPGIHSLFTNDSLLNKIKLSFFQSSPEPCAVSNQITEFPQPSLPESPKMTEYTLVYEILTAFLNLNEYSLQNIFKTDTIALIKLSHLTQEALFSILGNFTTLNSSYIEIKLWLELNKNSEAKVLSSFCLAVNERIKKFEHAVIENLKKLLNKTGQPLTLIRLKCEFFIYSEEFLVILSLIHSIPDAPPAYQCSELLSTLYTYSETAFIEHDFLLSLFFITFSQYIYETCLWMTSGHTSSESLITKSISEKFEWESFSVRLLKINQNIKKCVPIFITKDCKKILAIGNYQFLFNKILNMGIKFSPILQLSGLHDTITARLKYSLDHLEHYITVKNSIKHSFSSQINSVYFSMGAELFKIYNEKFCLMNAIKALQRIFLLQDPKFLQELVPVLQSFREKRPFEHLSIRLNKFFYENGYDGLCHCQELIQTSSIPQIKIFFHFPEIFSFVLGDAQEKYQKIFHFLLEVKLASGSIKTLNKEYDCILQRIQFVHFMDCFEFYAGQSIIMNTVYMFNNLEFDEIYSVKKNHKKFLAILMKKLFIEGDLEVFYEKVLKIFQCFNSIYYLNFIEDRFELDDFFNEFRANLKFVLKAVEGNREKFLREDCKKYLDLIADLMLGFNKFYESLKNSYGLV